MKIIDKILALKMPDERDSSLARRLNIPYTTLHSWRRGARSNPKISTLANISAALGCSLSDLVDPQVDIKTINVSQEKVDQNAARCEEN